MFLTASEWKEIGGKREAGGKGAYRPLPFDSCALSLQPYEVSEGRSRAADDAA